MRDIAQTVVDSAVIFTAVSNKAAEKLQRHNSRLFKIIVRTEGRLTRAAMRVVDKTREVDKK